MTVRLAVVAVIVWSQGWGGGGLSQSALAKSGLLSGQASAQVLTQKTEAYAEGLPVITDPVRSVPVRTLPFIDDEILDDEILLNDGILDDDIPEEILRTEIITEARSPLTGEPMSAADYAQLADELRSPAGGNLVSQELGYLIYLLQLRRAITPIILFL